jgi:beta-lactamase class A
MRCLLAAALFVAVAVAGCAPERIEAPAPEPARVTPAAASETPVPSRVRLPVGHPRRPARSPRPIPTSGPAPSTAVSLDGLLNGVLPDPDSDYGVVMEDLRSGGRTAVNEDRVFPSASLYKLGVAWMVLRQVDAGVLHLDSPMDIFEPDTVEPEPDGGVAAGDRPTVREALGDMLTISSNAAAHAFLRTLGRVEFNREMQRIGLSQTRIPEEVDADGSDGDAQAVTSAADIAHLLRLVATSQQLSVASRQVLADYMASGAPPDALRDTLPDGIDVLEKTGNLDDASNVGALLRSTRGTVILVVIDHGVDPGDARGVIAQAGQVAYQALLQDASAEAPR